MAATATAYTAGQSAVDPQDSSLWICEVSHTSAALPTTFAQDRIAHPTYWLNTSATLFYLPLTGGTLTGNLGIQQPAGVGSLIIGSTNGSGNWVMALGDNSPRLGSNSGSNFVLYRYADDGVTILSTPITVDRSNGNIGLNNPVFAGASVTATDFYATHGYSLSVNGAFIGGDANVTYFIQDSAGWRWQYERANGTMHWIAGATNTLLFSIDGFGNVIAKGTITASGSPVVTEARIAELEARIAALEAKV